MKANNYAYNILHNFIPALISIACFGFVAIKITDCIKKYIDEPIANTVTIEDNEGLPFPTVTICPNWFGSGTKSKELKKCDLKGSEYEKGNWIGNCSDPELLYNSMVLGFDDLVSNRAIITKDGNETNKDKSSSYKAIDSLYGRCYSIFPRENILKDGIVQLKVKSEHQHVIVHISSTGEFLTGKYGPGLDQKSTILLEYTHGETPSYKTHYETLVYEVFEELNTENHPCNESINYSKDACFLEKLHDESIKQIGCTTPYGLNKSMICKETGKAQKALDLFARMQRNSTCLNPCAYLVPQTYFTYQKKNNQRFQLYLSNNGAVKVTRSELAYDTLTLLADIGGYVGLFLGIAIVHVKELFQILALKMKTQ